MDSRWQCGSNNYGTVQHSRNLPATGTGVHVPVRRVAYSSRQCKRMKVVRFFLLCQLCVSAVAATTVVVAYTLAGIIMYRLLLTVVGRLFRPLFFFSCHHI